MTPNEPDTILLCPGGDDPKPCAICNAPVYSELQQVFTEDTYGLVLCCDCEFSFFWEAYIKLKQGFPEEARIYRDFAYLHVPEAGQ